MLLLILLSVLASLGFGRFSFGAILPFMKEGLVLNYKETGIIAASIFLGYLISVVASGFFVIRYAAKKVIIVSLLIIVVGMIITANAQQFLLAFGGCFLIGIGTGGSYVPSLGLLGQWFAPKKRGMAMGIAMAGSGVGMVFSGVIVPILIVSNGIEGWRMSWYILALLVMVISIVIGFFLKNHPQDFQLKPIGEQNEIPQQLKQGMPSPKPSSSSVYRNTTLWVIGLIYLSWGLSYLIFSTFLVDYLITDIHFSNHQAGFYFAVAGIASILSGFIWGSISDKVGRMPSLMLVFFTQFLVLLGLSFSSNSVFIFFQVLIYGLTLWGTPTIINASVGDYIQVKYIPVAMGFVTLFFSVGQFLSPVITGYMIELSQSYMTAFIFSSITALFCGIGSIVLFVFERKKEGIATSLL